MTVYALRITANVIEEAVCGDPQRCAIAIAGREQTVLQKWRVDGDFVRAFDPETYVWLLWRMPISALRAAKQFDNGDRSVPFPKMLFNDDDAVELPPYATQGHDAINLHTMDVSEIEERAARMMDAFRAGKRSYIAESKRERNKRLRVDSDHVAQPLTDAQKQRDRNNRRFGRLAHWDIAAS